MARRERGPICISITMGELYRRYCTGSGNRHACPVMTPQGEATHIYYGFGAYRLEKIAGKPKVGKRGFQGEEVAKGSYDTKIRICD